MICDKSFSKIVIISARLRLMAVRPDTFTWTTEENMMQIVKIVGLEHFTVYCKLSFVNIV